MKEEVKGKQIVFGPRRTVIQLGAAMTLAQVLAACGGGGGGDDEHTVTSDHTPPTIDKTDRSTFLIVYKHAAANGGRELLTAFASGFSITDKYIATNAHVTVGIMEQAIGLFPEHEITRVSAYQAGTGEEFPCVLAITHPSYDDNTRGPDVGMFQTTRVMTDHLTLAPESLSQAIKRTDKITVAAFPGELYPGFSEDTIPIATLFSGEVQALRMFDERVTPTPTTYDMIDVNAQLTPGTSGSAVVFNNFVIAVNNAGPDYFILKPPSTPNGPPERGRIASGANNYAVHVKFLHQLVQLHEKGGMAPRDHQVLPPPRADVAAQAPANQGQGRSYTGAASTNEQIQFTVAAENKFTGTSSRGQGVTLTGQYFTPEQLRTQGQPLPPSGRLLLTDNVQTNAAQNIYPRLYSIDYNPQTMAVGGNGIIREQRVAGQNPVQVGTWTAAQSQAQRGVNLENEPLKPKIRM